MSDWNLICQKGWWRYIADNCYTSAYFPIEARGLLASWLETPEQDCIWQFNELAHQTHIHGFIKKMVDELVERSNALPMNTDHEFFYKCRIDDIVRQMQGQVLTNWLEVFAHMKINLANEKREISRLNNGNNGSTTSTVPPTTSQFYGESTPQKGFSQLNQEITAIIQQITTNVKTADSHVEECNAYYSALQNDRLSRIERMTQLGQQGGHNGIDFRNSYEYQLEMGHVTQIDAKLTKAPENVRQVYSQVIQTIPDLEKVYGTAVQELRSFKDDQQFIELGKESERDLDKIDKWFGDITECFCVLQHALQILKDMCQASCSDTVSSVQAEFDKISNLRSDMISSCLVIETQPKQIIRTDTRFGPVKLRLLSCSKNMMVDKSSVIKILINDVQASELVKAKAEDSQFLPQSIGKLETTKGYPRIEGNHVPFKDFKVTKPKRGTKRGEKAVTEEQFHIFFQVTVNIEGNLYTLWTMTLPMIITTHPTQEGDAWATILWNNSLPNHKRLPFSKVLVPEDVSWSNLLELIDLLFLKRGKRLSEDNKAYLKSRIFRGQSPANDMVGYNLFCKDAFVTVNIKLLSTVKKVVKSEIVNGADGEPGKIFTFWMWLWSCLELLDWTPEDPSLLTYSLKNLWIDNKIVGFISENDLKNKLNHAADQFPNTNSFILRFPEGRPDSIGVYFYGATTQGPRTLIKFTYLEEELNKLPLHQRINQNHLISHLYPNIEKEEAFKKAVDRESIINAYFKIGLKEYLPSSFFHNIVQSAISEQGGGGSSPSTSSRSHSYRSYHSHSQSQVPSPASVSAHSESSNPYIGAFSAVSPGSCSTTTLTVDHLANHQMMETSDFGMIGMGISSWVQDGITTSSLNF